MKNADVKLGALVILWFALLGYGTRPLFARYQQENARERAAKLMTRSEARLVLFSGSSTHTPRARPPI